jgi:hypothetical protein
MLYELHAIIFPFPFRICPRARSQCAPTGRSDCIAFFMSLRFNCSDPIYNSMCRERERETLLCVYNMIHDSGAHYNVLDMHDITTAPLFVERARIFAW